MKKKKLFAVPFAVVASLAIATGAFANDGVADTGEQKAGFEIEGGDLTLQVADINDFGKVHLDGTSKVVTTSFTDSFKVTDARGTGEGWRLDVSSTQFEVVEPDGGFAEGTTANILPVGTLSLSPLETIEQVGIGESILPTSMLSAASIIDDGSVSVAKADIGEGMGEFDLTFGQDALSVALDPSTAKIDKVNYPDSSTPYEATVTWNLVSAP